MPDSAQVASHFNPDEQSQESQDTVQRGLRILAKLIAARMQAERLAHEGEELVSYHSSDRMASEDVT